MSYAAVAATSGLSARDADILASTDRPFYQVQEGACGTAVSKETSVIQYTITQENQAAIIAQHNQ